jgi:hypothetical protein
MMRRRHKYFLFISNHSKGVQNLLYTYFNRKWRLHVNPQDLKITMLVGGKRKRKTTHYYHYNFVVKNTLIHDVLINFHDLTTPLFFDMPVSTALTSASPSLTKP